nr:putative replication associated protein [Crucivirus sp.]
MTKIKPIYNNSTTYKSNTHGDDLSDMGKNRSAIKQWFITYPKILSSMTREKFMDDLKNVLGQKIQYLRVVLEHHEDGGEHLHSILLMKGSGLSYSAINKFFKDLYPNENKRIHFRPIRVLSYAIDYCDKEDIEDITYGELSIENGGVRQSDEVKLFLNEIKRKDLFQVPQDILLKKNYQMEILNSCNQYLLFTRHFNNDERTILYDCRNHMSNKKELVRFMLLFHRLNDFLITFQVEQKYIDI